MAKKQRSVSVAPLHITIGSGPSGLNFENELRLVKSALLYADRVKLCSPGAFMLFAVADLQNLGMTLKVEMLEGVIPVLPLNPSEATALLEVLHLYREIKKSRKRSRDELLLQGRLERGIRDGWESIRAKSEELVKSTGAQELIEAKLKGLLEVHMFKTSKVLAMSRAIEAAVKFNAGVEGPSWDDILTEFLDVIRSAIATESTYPLFDDRTGSLVRAMAEEAGETGAVSAGRSDQAKQVGLASDVISRLPLFEKASVQEVIDIRKDLRSALVRFRAGMIRFADTVRSSPWEDDFPLEAEKVFRAEVEPAVMEIEEAVEDNGYLKQLSYRVVSQPYAVPAGSIFGLGVAQVAALPHVAAAAFGATLTTAGTAYTAYKEWMEKKHLAERNQMYFYYGATTRLRQIH